MKNITVFCGSQISGTKQKYYTELAYNTGKIIAKNNYVCVNGGTTGMMQQLSRGAQNHDGKVMAIVLDHPDYPITNTFYMKQEKYTDLNKRQNRLIELADAFFILPGAIGTLYEACEVISKRGLKQIAYTPIIFIDEYYKNLQKVFNSIQSEGFAWMDLSQDIHFCATAEEAIQIIKQYESAQ